VWTLSWIAFSSYSEKTMPKRNWTPEDRERWRAQRDEWARQRLEFETLFARWEARVQGERERRERRRLRLRRLLPFLA
jgi:hypothetical protein